MQTSAVESRQSMRAAVISQETGLRLREGLSLPVPAAGEVLIKVKYSGICGTDIHVLHGKHPTATYPVIPGHEFVGELVGYGGDLIPSLKIGDMVAAQPFFSCGNCEPCAKGQDNVCCSLQVLGCHADGSFAQYVKAPMRKVYKLPEGSDLQLACLTEPLAVAVHDVRRSGLTAGGSALIIGGGPIGLLIAIVARFSGATGLVISEISEYRRTVAEALGFRTINPLEDGLQENLGTYSENRGFDVVFEVSGSKSGISTAINQAKIAGTVVVVGMASEEHPVSLSKVFQKELRIQGVRVHSQINFIGALDLLRSGKLDNDLRVLISKVYPIEQVEEAFAHSQGGDRFFKILVSMEH